MNTVDLASPDVGAVILAAGRSTRMGRPKMLLPWGKTSVLGHQIRTWQQLGAGQTVVVCAAGDSAICAELDRLHFPDAARIQNPEPARGMFSSIQCAARWTGWRPEIARVAIVLGDQPHVRIETLRALLEFSAAHPAQVCQPRAAGRLRHPVILPKEVFARLARSGAPSLRDFLATVAAGIATCDLTDAGLEYDLDTPADYERARAHCLRRNSGAGVRPRMQRGRTRWPDLGRDHLAGGGPKCARHES